MAVIASGVIAAIVIVWVKCELRQRRLEAQTAVRDAISNLMGNKEERWKYLEYLTQLNENRADFEKRLAAVINSVGRVDRSYRKMAVQVQSIFDRVSKLEAKVLPEANDVGEGGGGDDEEGGGAPPTHKPSNKNRV
jgi:hypothetical protein